MVGIVSYGAYIPALRIDRSVIAEAWGRNTVGGERSVANEAGQNKSAPLF